MDETHDPARRSWVESANAPGAPFPIQNLPFGIFSTAGQGPRAGVAIGDEVLDLAALEAAGLLAPGPAPVFARAELNAFLALGPAAWRETRRRLVHLLDAATPRLRDDTALRAAALVPQAEARMHLPVFVRSFTDFYASREHAEAVGAMFRGPERALMENWLHLPVGYNGRASTVVVSGTPVRRPMGQLKGPEDPAPRFAPSARLDMEVELGCVVGTPSEMGRRLSTAAARAALFGYVLLNDWSARDIQLWEYQPLGPFLSKAFATTISPWIVTAEALAPFAVPGPAPEAPPLPYLREDGPGNLDIAIEARLETAAGNAATLCRTNARHLYWSPAQMLAHHSASGCAMCTGDLLGSGTISGPGAEAAGSLLERTRNGRAPLAVGSETRGFLEDGDTVTLTGAAEGAGYRLGFGACAGRILPALTEEAP